MIARVQKLIFMKQSLIESKERELEIIQKKRLPPLKKGEDRDRLQTVQCEMKAFAK